MKKLKTFGAQKVIDLMFFFRVLFDGLKMDKVNNIYTLGDMYLKAVMHQMIRFCRVGKKITVTSLQKLTKTD